MYLNLWSYKAVRHRYSNPMIQPELEGSTYGYPLVSVEVLSQNWKDLPRDIPLDSVEVLRILTDGGEANSLQEMDDPNIIMEEYIQLIDDKAQRCSETFNWETATYGNVYCDDSDLFTDFEKDFPATVYDDASTLNQNASSEPT
nr:hypothetical protein [Tanacetum cinerariifolium]